MLFRLYADIKSPLILPLRLLPCLSAIIKVITNRITEFCFQLFNRPAMKIDRIINSQYPADKNLIVLIKFNLCMITFVFH